MAEYIDMGDKYSIEDILEAGRKLCKDPTSLTEAKRNWFMEGFKVGYFQCLGDYVLNKNKDGVPKKYAPDEFFNHKRQTNADRIRKMSDEELAEYLFDRGNGSEYCYGICAYQEECHECHAQEFCIQQIVAWLKQEVDNADPD